MAPREVHILMPGTVDVTSQGERDLADVIQLRTSRWGDYPGLSRWVQCNHKGPHVRRRLKVRDRETGQWKQRPEGYELMDAGDL